MTSCRWVAMVAVAFVGCAAPAVRVSGPDAGSLPEDAGAAVDGGAVPDAGLVIDAGPMESYGACSYVGAIDRIGIWHLVDVSTGECVYLGLSSPGGATSPFSLSLPTNWGVESARLGRPVRCDCASGRWFDGADSIDGSGSVSFALSDGGYWPESVSIDATLTFEGGAQVLLQADALPVLP